MKSKQTATRLKHGGVLLETSTYRFLFLKHGKLQVSIPAGLPLSEAEKAIGTAFQNMKERRA